MTVVSTRALLREPCRAAAADAAALGHRLHPFRIELRRASTACAFCGALAHLYLTVEGELERSGAAFSDACQRNRH